MVMCIGNKHTVIKFSKYSNTKDFLEVLCLGKYYLYNNNCFCLHNVFVILSLFHALLHVIITTELLGN